MFVEKYEETSTPEHFPKDSVIREKVLKYPVGIICL
jgi:hypothetical protein